MTPWEERPVEVANLLNPAFLSLLLHRTVAGYMQIKARGMPYALLFLAPPFILHEPTRNSLPKRTTTKLTNWLSSQPIAAIGYYERTKRLVPYTKEGIIYGINSGLFLISGEGNLVLTPRKLRKPRWPKESEPEQCRKMAKFVGKWLASAGDVNTVYSILGIHP
jgi:hypothetical protein